MTSEHKRLRKLVEAYTDPEVVELVIEKLDEWARDVERAKDALEQQATTDEGLQRYYTVRELRLLLKLSDSGVRKLLDDGVLPMTRIGGVIRVPVADVDRYLAEHTSRSEVEPKPRGPRRRVSPEDEAVLQRWPFLAD